MAFEMYLEGLGFRATGRLLRISYGTAYQRIKNWEKQVELPKSNEQVDVVELDEMHTYVGRKNFRWVWIAVDRYGKRFLSFVCGDRSSQTGVRLCGIASNI